MVNQWLAVAEQSQSSGISVGTFFWRCNPGEVLPKWWHFSVPKMGAESVSEKKRKVAP